MAHWTRLTFSNVHPLWGGYEITVESNGKAHLVEAPRGGGALRECKFQVDELPPVGGPFEEEYLPQTLPPDTTIFRLGIETGGRVRATRWADHTPIPEGLKELKNWLLDLAARV